MSERTIGQIAYEKWLSLQRDKANRSVWGEASEDLRAEWEGIAEAVREEVDSWNDPRSYG